VPAVAAAPVAVPESTPFEPIELAEPEADDHGMDAATPAEAPPPLARHRSPRWRWRRSRRPPELKRAAADAEVARRVERLEPVVPSIAPAPRPRPRTQRPPRHPIAGLAEAASPYARMGIVDDASPAFDDLDAVLRRRARPA
jgi:hypothetical protein